MEKIDSKTLKLFREAFEDMAFHLHEIGSLSEDEMQKRYHKDINVWFNTIADKIKRFNWADYMIHQKSYTTSLGDTVTFTPISSFDERYKDIVIKINGKVWRPKF